MKLSSKKHPEASSQSSEEASVIEVEHITDKAVALPTEVEVTPSSSESRGEGSAPSTRST